MSVTDKPTQINAHILAGGQASRMGGVDKGLIQLDAKPLIAHVLQRLSPQVDQFCISANRNRETYQAFGWPVFADSMANHPGPLAGFLTALEHCSSEWIINVPCDCPFLPTDLVARLQQAISSSSKRVAVVSSEDRLQPTFCLLHRSLKDSLSDFLHRGERKTGLWIKQQDPVIVDFSDKPDAFMNINTPEELKHAEELSRHD